MNTSHDIRPLPRSFASRLAPAVSREAQQLVRLGRERGWAPAVVGHAPLPSEPFRYKDWVVVPAEQDTSLVPARALQRVQDLFSAGLRPKGFVVVHEAPRLLSAPAGDTPRPLDLSPISAQLKSGLKVAGAVLGVTAAALAAVSVAAVLVVGVLAVAALAVPALAVAAVVVDPILIAVTEDGWWIEIDRWDA